MSPAYRHGGRAIRGIGAGGKISILRYKMSQRRNSLVLLTKQTISRARRYKNSCRRNLLF
jgi:hypothetical protein